MNLDGLLRKRTGPVLRGSLHKEWKRCGKPGCRCARGKLHGPYWDRHWRENHRQRKEYVRHEELKEVQFALIRWRELHPPVWSMRQRLACLGRLSREVYR